MDRTGLLAGKRAFITGGAQGIGLAVARAFRDEGAEVILADVDAGALAALRTNPADASFETLALDVTDAEATEAAARRLSGPRGIDVVVVNAGILLLGPAIQTPLDGWRRVIDVNLTGAFISAAAFGRRMVERGRGGRIIFTSSLFGLRGGRDNGAYAASKFGVIGLMQCLAAELAPSGILVNAVCPGQIDTRMVRDLFERRAASQGTTAAALREGFEARIPLGRLGPIEDVAGAYVYLASDLSRYVVGQSLSVDGGWQVG